ncbi:MAG: hypothetical protein PHI37_01915 [Candidatus Gracilibacteria bacterium]|nr:hypothetical protein [Candidatus Gracilibacteria bacterium]
MGKYFDLLKNTNEKNLASLDLVVMAALDLFSSNLSVNIPNFSFKKPVIVGSGNAKNTSKILYENKDVYYADENNYKEIISMNGVDGVIIFSASGGKHAPIVAQYAKQKNLRVKLVTCNENNETKEIIGEENIIVTPRNLEPYTYNTSTYMGWIIAKTKENPKEISDYIEQQLKTKIDIDFTKYNSFLFVIPNEFANIAPLIEVKFIELFGRNIARDVKTFEEMKHAITVVPDPRELCIRFGKEDIYFSGDMIDIELPDFLGLAGFMAVSYYIVGVLQNQFPPYFKNHIENYISYLNKSDFGKNIKIIV